MRGDENNVVVINRGGWFRAAIYLCCLTFALVASPSAFAQFDKANQEYSTGKFKEAINDYEALVQKGEYSANLFYDLGNAYFRTQDPGRAILNYERALALDRHHPEAQANLRLVRDEARALELQPSVTDKLLRFTSNNELTVLAAVAGWLFLFSIARIVFSRRCTFGLVAFSVLSFLICLSTVAVIYLAETGNNGAALAIVTSKDVEARVATADNASRVLLLPPGSEIKVVSRRGDWLYATLPNQLRGWIPVNSAESVRM